MKLTTPFAVFTLFAATHALPNPNGLLNSDPDSNHLRFPIPPSMTVQEGSSKCGDQAQLSCCNKAAYAGDTTKVSDGIASGLLSNLIGGGSGADGLGLFSQCSKVNVRLLISPGDILNKQCKQTVACCANSGHSASHDLIGASLPCVALGSIL
ncbi:hypothetical protein BJY04DRAFT_228552 [Aspergillus karnatakaensis]|uniref:hydrophobin family protein n=1 Tax=Aspergillus karnatakaensis TaxID=1810916 RepID=UPI003CCCC9BF